MLRIAAIVATAWVAISHVGFLVLEMFFWDKPLGLRVFGHAPEFAKASKVLAANQGLYNGFLAVGLLWGLSRGAQGRPVVMFFLGCVIVAGAFGAMTASGRILWIQALPAVIALALIRAA